MSMHKSLQPKGRLKRQRNVLTRRERVEKLLEEGDFEEGEDSVFGLPRVKQTETVQFAFERQTDEEEEEEEETEGEEADVEQEAEEAEEA